MTSFGTLILAKLKLKNLYLQDDLLQGAPKIIRKIKTLKLTG